MPLDFFTSGSGSASLINWPSSFTFPNVILLSGQRRGDGWRRQQKNSPNWASGTHNIQNTAVCVCVYVCVCVCAVYIHSITAISMGGGNKSDRLQLCLSIRSFSWNIFVREFSKHAHKTLWERVNKNKTDTSIKSKRQCEQSKGHEKERNVKVKDNKGSWGKFSKIN